MRYDISKKIPFTYSCVIVMQRLKFTKCYYFRIVTISELLHFSKFEMLLRANERTTAIICIDFSHYFHRTGFLRPCPGFRILTTCPSFLSILKYVCKNAIFLWNWSLHFTQFDDLLQEKLNFKISWKKRVNLLVKFGFKIYLEPMSISF